MVNNVDKKSASTLHNNSKMQECGHGYECHDLYYLIDVELTFIFIVKNVRLYIILLMSQLTLYCREQFILY